jgi:hypothetical protein
MLAADRSIGASHTSGAKAAWNLATPTGPVWYYNGLLDLLALLILSGQYRVY